MFDLQSLCKMQGRLSHNGKLYNWPAGYAFLVQYNVIPTKHFKKLDRS